MDLGARLKELRKEKRLTLKELSDITGLSMGFLSNVERGINSPTISSLQKICAALNITLVELLQTPRKDRVVVRKSERRVIYTSSDGKTKYEMLVDGNKKMQPLCITMAPGGIWGEAPLGHPGEEFGMVIKGKMEIEVDGVPYLLEEGDTIYIDAKAPHKYKNVGNSECISVWTVLGPLEKIMRKPGE